MKMRLLRRKRLVWRSYRQLRQVLFAFASAGAVLGAGLLLLYVYRRQSVLLWLGAVYLMLAGTLAGICRILAYWDDLRRRKRYHVSERSGFSAP